MKRLRRAITLGPLDSTAVALCTVKQTLGLNNIALHRFVAVLSLVQEL